MKLLRLQLENFRNYPQFTHEFDQDGDILIIHGKNGLGKTNILEAVYLLSIGKSFRLSEQDDLILWDREHFRVKGSGLSDHEEVKMEVFYGLTPRRKKNFKLNDVNVRHGEYVGNLISVLFQPEDLNILYLSPSLRRKYLDILLSQTSRGYLSDLYRYGKAIKQRNALLASIREAKYQGGDLQYLSKDLDVWDVEIVEIGSRILEKRLEFIAFAQKRLTEVYRSISAQDEKIELEYISKAIKGESPTILEEIKKIYSENLQFRRERDLILATSTCGPHRDDFILYINGRNAGISASRGEMRTLLLALKLIEIEFIREKSLKNPILLLDDVFSELDEFRQIKLLDAIRGCQTIITSTDSIDLAQLSKKLDFKQLAI